MARGHVQGPASDQWGRDRTQITGRWPEVLVRLDLAYWADPISCDGKRRPSVRTLASTWGWPPSTVGDFIRTWDAERSDTSRTVPGQSPDTEPAPQAQRSDASGHLSDTSRTPLGQPLSSTRARSSATSATSAGVSPAADARAREPGPPSEDIELQAAELMALQEADEPQHGMRPPRDLGALRRALQRGVPAERLAALWAWSGVSEDPSVAGCRAGWRHWSALLKAPRGDERVAAAWAWHEAGRPVDAPARASPGRKQPSFDDAFAAIGLGPSGATSPPLRLVLPGDST